MEDSTSKSNAAQALQPNPFGEIPGGATDGGGAAPPGQPDVSAILGGGAGCDRPLIVLADGGEHLIDPSALLDAGAAGLADHLKESAEPPVFDLRHLLDWTDGERWAILNLLKEMGGHCLARAAAEAEAQANVFAVVLSMMVGPADITRCERGWRAAVEAAALLYGDALKPACTLIWQRLKELGVKNVPPQEILKEARNVAGEADEGRRDPAAAARAFLGHLAEGAVLQQGDRRLHFYRDDFYEWVAAVKPWESGRWHRPADEELKARLTRFLQGGDREEQVTQRFVGDVLANLKGLAMLDVWGEEMPFLVSGGQDETPLITRPRFAVFENGMIDLDEALGQLGEAVEHGPFTDTTPEIYEAVPDYFTVNRLPFHFDPDAWCPLWEQTLGEVLPSTSPGDHRREVLQEFMGWTILPGDLRYQKFLTLVGKGSNGKSTICDVWVALLGAHNVSHVSLNHLDGEFRLYEMAGKLANIASDMSRLDRVEEGVLKQLTTGDPLQVNRKHKPTVTLRPTARLVFGTNTLSPFSDRSDGVWRRMIALPFLVQIPPDQVDPQRVQSLKEELPGIFNWALAGAARLHRQGRFTHCSVCERCVADHRHDSDPFKQFVDERVQFGPTLQVGAEPLFKKYVEFCEGSKRRPQGNSEFGKQVLALAGVTKDRESGGKRPYYYRGLDLATDLGAG